MSLHAWHILLSINNRMIDGSSSSVLEYLSGPPLSSIDPVLEVQPLFL